MIEIRVHKKIEHVQVERDPSIGVVVSIPQNSSWKFLFSNLSEHLTSEELDLAQKLWCDDDFPRVFNTYEHYVAIKPLLN